jgi:hypothetical protein
MVTTSKFIAKGIKTDCNHLRIHYEIVVMLYSLAVLVSIKILSFPQSQKDLVTLLSVGAILATFGSAIGSIGLIWQNDLLERVRLNTDIFFTDIIRQDSPWRRWPFLTRAGKRKLLDGSSLHLTLNNPEVPLDVGTHVIKVDLPTSLEDFFDLPLIRNCWSLIRFRNSAHTVFSNKPKDVINPNTGLKSSDEYMAYECMFDTWKAVLKFRVARYIVHFGSGLTIAGAGIVASFVVMHHQWI